MSVSGKTLLGSKRLVRKIGGEKVICDWEAKFSTEFIR
jgi:hypothetical protein